MKNYLLAFGAFVFSVSFVTPEAHAFPANVRHGYPNCTACHLSPGGGGVLTAYGRELSREIQSTFGTEGETPFAFGIVKTPEWLDAGGDFRYLEIIQDTPKEIDGRGFWMQGDLEAGVHIGKFAVDGTLGWKGNSEGIANQTTFLSRRHFAMYSISDQFTVRGGRFYPVFGLMQPEHEDATRAPIGFDENMESYNLEFSMQNENGSLFVSPILGKLRGNDEPDEKGLAISKNFIVAGNSRLGVSALYGKGFYQTAYDHRVLLGPNAIIAFSKKVFWLGEVDFEKRSLIGSRDSETGLYQYQKLSYEPIQGVILSGRQDLQRRMIGDARTSVVTAGPVIDWYPRPHFDFQASFARAFVPEGSDNFWVYTGMLHFYL